jgi:septum formation protein
MSRSLKLQSAVGPLLLASASPRRREILEAAGFDFQVVAVSVEERQLDGEPPEEFVCRVAAEKARVAMGKITSPRGSPILAADTVVVAEGQTLGKPASAEEARRMLRLLSGKEHRVLTGVCLLFAPAHHTGVPAAIREDTRLASTTVRFTLLSEEEIEEYIAGGEPFDKAGAYAIQGRASKFVEQIQGCYFNVVGLPVSLVYQMLKDLDSALRQQGNR